MLQAEMVWLLKPSTKSASISARKFCRSCLGGFSTEGTRLSYDTRLPPSPSAAKLIALYHGGPAISKDRVLIKIAHLGSGNSRRRAA